MLEHQIVILLEPVFTHEKVKSRNVCQILWVIEKDKFKHLYI